MTLSYDKQEKFFTTGEVAKDSWWCKDGEGGSV
jgi:hypothetical protein